MDLKLIVSLVLASIGIITAFDFGLSSFDFGGIDFAGNGFDFGSNGVNVESDVLGPSNGGKNLHDIQGLGPWQRVRKGRRGSGLYRSFAGRMCILLRCTCSSL